MELIDPPSLHPKNTPVAGKHREQPVVGRCLPKATSSAHLYALLRWFSSRLPAGAPAARS